MTILTHQAIRENPWNAVTHDLPVHTSRFLLTMAFAATRYCVHSEWEFLLAARRSLSLPQACRSHQHPNVRNAIERRWWLANVRLRALADMLKTRGVATDGSG